jgi:tagaturonate reductase
MSTLPETVLQFGSGRFLRAFADLFIHQANEGAAPVGKVVLVQSTSANRADSLTRQGGRYHVIVRGLEQGSVVDRVEPVECISRALAAGTQWDEVLAVARSPELRLILSNTTEAGYALDPIDVPRSQGAPRSFPAKLLTVLYARFEAGLAGVTIVPVELQAHNADLLFSIVDKLAAAWELPQAFRTWMAARCAWLNTLVDRIVTDPQDHPLMATDALLAVCEPYALWAIQRRPAAWEFLHNPHAIWTPDVMPYFLRKVRILNATHTALVIQALPRGFRTVREAVLDPALGAWLERLLFEEIVPVLQGRVEEPDGFARQTLERFKNPFLEHKLADIAQHHAEKVRIRLAPTRDEFWEKFGKPPSLLTEVLAMPQPG